MDDLSIESELDKTISFYPSCIDGGSLRRIQLPSFKRPCRYCSKLVTPEDLSCPFCGKESPIYIRCPNCNSEIRKDYVRCPSCSISLQIYCPNCNAQTFFDVYCEKCGKKIEIECSKCHTKQPPVRQKCISCHKSLAFVAKPVV
jgi:hypothetical protein